MSVCLFAVGPEPEAPSWVRMCSSEQAALPLWGSLWTHGSPPSLLSPLHLCSTTCEGETYPQGCLLRNSPGTEPIHPPPPSASLWGSGPLTAELCLAWLLAGFLARAAAISGHVSAAKREASPDPPPLPGLQRASSAVSLQNACKRGWGMQGRSPLCRKQRSLCMQRADV